MKTFKVFVAPCALGLTMCLALFAQEPQGRGGQGAPGPGGAALSATLFLTRSSVWHEAQTVFTRFVATASAPAGPAGP
jgi:hypothetical protein